MENYFKTWSSFCFSIIFKAILKQCVFFDSSTYSLELKLLNGFIIVIVTDQSENNICSRLQHIKKWCARAIHYFLFLILQTRRRTKSAICGFEKQTSSFLMKINTIVYTYTSINLKAFQIPEKNVVTENLSFSKHFLFI